MMDQRDNLAALSDDLTWVWAMLEYRLAELESDAEAASPPPSAPSVRADTRYGGFVAANRLGEAERLVLALALLPHLCPDMLNSLQRNECFADHFGCVRGRQFGGFLPSAQTAVALLAGRSVFYRSLAMKLFAPDGELIKRGLVGVGTCGPGEPSLGSPLFVDEETVGLILRGEGRMDFSGDFPARLIETDLEWDDLVLPPVVSRQIEEILDWEAYRDDLAGELGMKGHLRPGFRALFHGPSGTGKTLTAVLLGKRAGRPVYRVDTAQVISKYVGETQKNLERIFQISARKRWILFFDEADSLLGRRTGTDSANDRFANQETAYLLQRLECHPGLTVLATNILDNIDPAFHRRFNIVTFFPLPGRDERMRLWHDCLGTKLRLDAECEEWLSDVSLSGGQIATLSQRLGIRALKNGTRTVELPDLKRMVAYELSARGER